MTMVSDATVLNAMASSANIAEWQTPAFDAVQLNDTNQPTRLYRVNAACGQMIIKSGTASYWHDAVAFSLTGGIRGDKSVIAWLCFFAPATVGILDNILVGIYDGTGGQGGSGIGGRWRQDLLMEIADIYGWWPAIIYPSQPDETKGTFANLVKTSMDSIELDVSNTGGIDVKLAGMGQWLTISYIGGHSQTVSFDDLVNYSASKSPARDYGVAFKDGDNYTFRAVLRIGDAAATATTTHSPTVGAVTFKNANSDHDLGYEFINDPGGDLIVFSPDGIPYTWTEGDNSTIWDGENNVDTWTPANCNWRGAGLGAKLPDHATGKTTNGHTFDACGPIDIHDGVCEDGTWKNAPGSATIYKGSTATRRHKRGFYRDCDACIEFDTAGTYDVDGHDLQDASNTYEIRNSSGGLVTLNAINGASITSGTNPATVDNVGGGSTTQINNPATVTIGASDGAAAISLVGAEIAVYDLNNLPAGSLGTELDHVESCPTATRAYSGSAGNLIRIQIQLAGFIEFNQNLTIPAGSTAFTAILRPETNE